jgi:hypothetical protein
MSLQWNCVILLSPTEKIFALKDEYPIGWPACHVSLPALFSAHSQHLLFLKLLFCKLICPEQSALLLDIYAMDKLRTLK